MDRIQRSDHLIFTEEALKDGKQYGRKDEQWVEIAVQEALSDGKQYTRKNGVWDEVDVTEAPSDSKQYARQNGAWVQVVTGGTNFSTLSASGTLAINTEYLVTATGDFTFIVPNGSSNGDKIVVSRNSFFGQIFLTGLFSGSETRLIVNDSVFSIELTWYIAGNYWFFSY